MLARIVLLPVVFFSCFALCTDPAILNAALTILEKGDTKCTQIKPSKAKLALINETDLDRFATLYMDLCNEKGIQYSTTCSIFEQAAKKLKYPVETAHSVFAPKILDTLLRSSILALVDYEKKPHDSLVLRKVNGTAYNTVFLLYDCEELIKTMSLRHASKFLEVLYRFAPTGYRYEVVFRRLYNRLKDDALIKETLLMFAKYYPFQYSSTLLVKYINVSDSQIPDLETFLTAFYARIKLMEDVYSGYFERAIYNIAFIISNNPPTPKSNEIIIDIITSGFSRFIFDSSVIIRNWAKYVTKWNDRDGVRVFLAAASIMDTKVESSEFSIAYGGLFAVCKEVLNASEESFQEFTSKKGFLEESMYAYWSYVGVVSSIPSVSSTFDLLKKEFNAKPRYSKEIIRLWTCLMDSIANIKNFVAELSILDHSEYTRIAAICIELAQLYDENDKFFKKEKFNMQGLVLALNSLAIINAADINDHSEVMIQFWGDAYDLYIGLTFELDEFIDQHLSSHSIDTICALYPAWKRFLERYITVHSFDKIDSQDLEMINGIIDTFSDEPDLTKIELAIHIMKHYEIAKFVGISKNLERYFEIEMSSMYTLYLSESLLQISRSEGAHLKTFQNGSLLNFLRYISDAPDRYVPLTLFLVAERLFTRDLF